MGAPRTQRRTWFPNLLISWCCRRDLNSGPLPYQGSALPLSYGSELGAPLHSGAAGDLQRPCTPRSGPRPPLALEGVMPERTAPPKPPKAAEKEQKSERLAEALRANLARRKAQKRARGAAASKAARNKDSRQTHGQHPRARRPAAAGRHPDLRRQERLPDADAGGAPHRRAGDADQRAPALRHPHHDRRCSSRSAARWRACSRAGCSSSAPRRSPTTAPTTRSCARCAPRSWCSGRCWRATATPSSRCPAAAPSARARSTCTCAASRRSAPSSTCATATSTPPRRTGCKGAVFEFPFVSVGATENLLMAATLARGTTVLKNAAREPEIVDLAQCLRRMGAEIAGEGTATIEIRGVDRLHGATHPVVADRIELGTYMLAPAIAGGEVELVGGRRELVAAFADKLEEAGVEVAATNAGLQGQPRERPRPRRRRGDRPLPRLPDRPAGADDGAAHPRRRRQPPRGAHLREPLHARARAHAHGRADRGPRRHRHRHRRREAARARR